MAAEIIENLVDSVNDINIPAESNTSDNVKRYITILQIQKELEKQKEKVFLELNDSEKKEADNYLNKKVQIPSYLSVRDVAQILEVTPQMVRRYCGNGKIAARQRMEGSGKWLIPADQFITHPNWNKFMEKKNTIKKQSIKIAQKMVEYIEEDMD